MATKKSANQTFTAALSGLADIEDIARPVVAWATDYPSGFVIPPHSHRRAQLVYASAAVMVVTTERGMWVVPP